jgi:hypothetical protein
VLRGHHKKITGLAFSPVLLVSSGADAQVWFLIHIKIKIVNLIFAYINLGAAELNTVKCCVSRIS